MEIISREIFDKWQEAVSFASQYESKIEQRAISIIKRICQEFKAEMDYVEDVRYYRSSEVSYDLSFKKNYSDMTIMLNGEVTDLVCAFPHRWLFEDFENELIMGKKAFEFREAEAKRAAQAKRAAKKAEQEQLKQSAAAKLTEEERRALGL